MSNMTMQLEGLELLIWLIKRGDLPHEAVESMIEHNQSLDTTKLYLKSMIKSIEKKENE